MNAVVIEKPSADRDAVARHHAEGSVTRQHRCARFEDRFLQFDSSPLSADLGEIGAQPRAVGSHSVATRAITLAVENGFASNGVARHGRRPLLGRDAAEIRHDVSGVDFVDVVRRHPGVRDAGSDDADKLFVGCGCGAAELAAAQVHACDSVAVGPVTGGASRQKEPPAVLHVRRRVLVLRRHRRHRTKGQEEYRECKADVTAYECRLPSRCSSGRCRHIRPAGSSDQIFDSPYTGAGIQAYQSGRGKEPSSDWDSHGVVDGRTRGLAVAEDSAAGNAAHGGRQAQSHGARAPERTASRTSRGFGRETPASTI